MNGDGAGKPRGFLNSGAVLKLTRSGGGAIDYAGDVVKMWARMWAASRFNAVWLHDQSAEQKLYTMKLDVGTGGSAVFLPAGGASGSPFASLFGRPLIPTEYGAQVGTTGDLMLVDLSQYTLIDKGNIKAAASMHVRFEFDEMAYRFVWRIDGEADWDKALTPKSGGDTLSPFIALT